MDEVHGTLPASDPNFLPLRIPANLLATQSTPNLPTNLVNTLYPNLRNVFDTPPLNPQQSFPAQIPGNSVNIFPRPPAPFFFSKLKTTSRTKYR